MRARFGRQAVGHCTVAFSDSARVPDAFRALAERDLERDLDRADQRAATEEQHDG